MKNSQWAESKFWILPTDTYGKNCCGNVFLHALDLWIAAWKAAIYQGCVALAYVVAFPPFGYIMTSIKHIMQ